MLRRILLDVSGYALAGLCGLVRAQSGTADALHVQLDVAGLDSGEIPGRGPAREHHFVADFSGALHVWATARDGDTYLRVEVGEKWGEDDDSGGQTVAYMMVTVEPGDAVRVLVSVTPTVAGEVVLHLVAAPETDATRAAAAVANDGWKELKRLAESGETDAARKQVDGLVDALLATPGAEQSEDCAAACAMLAEWAGRLFKILKQREATEFVLRYRERCLPPHHFAIPYFRFALGATYLSFQDFETARRLMEPSLEELFVSMPKHPEPYRLGATLCFLLMATGDLEGAREQAARSLDGLTRFKGEEDPDTVAVRATYSDILGKLGDVYGALLHAERVYASRSQSLTEDDPKYVVAANNLARCLVDVGDFARAREIFEECRSLPSIGGPHAWSASRTNLAILCLLDGRYDEALPLVEQALAEFESGVPTGRTELELCNLMSLLAASLTGLGRIEEAHATLQEEIAMLSAILPPDSLVLATERGNLVRCKLELGRIEEGDRLLEQLLRDLAGMSRDNPELWRIEIDMVRSLASRGDRERSRALALGVNSAVRATLPGWVAVMSARELESRVASCSWVTSAALSFALAPELRDDELVSSAFSSSEGLRDVGLLLTSLDKALRNDAKVKSLRGEAAQASSKLAMDVHSGTTQDQLAEARNARDRIQRELATYVASMAGVPRVTPVDPGALAAACGKDAAIVTYRRYTRSAFGPEAPEPVECYCAFVVRPGARIELVDLGPAAPIAADVESWIELLELRAATAADPLGERLRAALFDPLRPFLEGARELVVVPDDAVFLVPFDVLPAGDGLLGDRYEVSIRLTTRELIAPKAAPSGAGLLVALGGVDFDDDPLGAGQSPSTLPAAPVDASAVPARRSSAHILRGTVWEEGFRDLPQTAVEAQGVVDLYGSVFGTADSTELLLGRRASRAVLEDLAPRASFLHLATHGWFAPDSIRSFDETASKAGGSTLSLTQQVFGSSPMVLCGLALAGANRAPDAVGRVPGLVTAEEIATWDLENCELAVLSACETNVGVHRAGQGVASLQKALQMAGARSVITSLCKVSDEAAKELMSDFYRRLWVEKKSKRQALWEAKRALRDAKDERGAPLYKAGDWAGWILSGDPH